jgi:osmotically-inducible protein OsmY
MAARLPTTPGAAATGGDLRSPITEGGRQVETATRLALHQSPYPELWHVTCEYHEGILTLRGHVSSFYMKQIAQTIVQHVEGVERVVNRVEVVRTRYPR